MTALDPTKPVQTPRRWWVNEYKYCLGWPYIHRAEADDAGSYHRLHCLEVIELTPAVREALEEKGLL